MIRLTLAVIFALYSGPVAAQSQPCGNRANMIVQLAVRYGETRMNARLPGSRAHLELYASQATGTWTILETKLGGISCIFMTGVAGGPLPPRGDGA